MKTLLVTLLCGISISPFSQVIQLDQKKSASDISLRNGDYTLYFKKKDVLDAIEEIKKVRKIDDELVADIRNDKLSVIDMKSKDPTDEKIIDLFHSNLGTYLIIKKKVSVYKSDKMIISVVADATPPIVELDGTTRFAVFFSPENSEGQIFLGDIDKRLSKNFF